MPTATIATTPPRPTPMPAPGDARHPTGRLPMPGGASTGPGRRLAAVVGLFLVLITGIVGYNALATIHERDQALAVNIASRQRALAERYIKDVLLKVDGLQADPSSDATILRHTADALLHGGTVLAVQGADLTTPIPPVSTDPRVIVKLEQERNLIGQLVATGNRIVAAGKESRTYLPQLQRLRVLGALVGTTSNDAVGQIILDAQGSLARVVRVGIGLGVLGALAALAMGVLLRRAGAQQTARFRALVQESSDLITVLDGERRASVREPGRGSDARRDAGRTDRTTALGSDAPQRRRRGPPPCAGFERSRGRPRASTIGGVRRMGPGRTWSRWRPTSWRSRCFGASS